MRLRYFMLSALFLAGFAPLAQPADAGKEIAAGNWKLVAPGPTGDQIICLLKAEKNDGKLQLSILQAQPGAEVSIQGVKAEKGLSFTIRSTRTYKIGKGERKFSQEETFVAAEASKGKAIPGSFGVERFPRRARLIPTDAKKLDSFFIRSDAGAIVAKAQGLMIQANRLRFQIRQAKDNEKRKELRAEFLKAQNEVDEKLPTFFREVVAKHPDSDAALDAATSLINMAPKAKLGAEEAKSLTALILKQARQFGPRYDRLNSIRIAELLLRQKGLEAVALLPIEPIAKGLTDKDPADFQFNTLTTYQSALEAAGRGKEASALKPRLAKLDLAMDQEYLKTVPPFQAKAYPGRKEKGANRVAVMELFTGAQCPPCVAADVAFDALNKAYKPHDLILLQYHMHIPGPDPLTNEASVARWDYYESLRGTPSTIFNGKPLAGGGGGMGNSESKFTEYAKIINSLLEKSSPVKLKGSAELAGDKLSIAVDVAGIESAKDLKLRLLIVEESIKYVGGNKLRFHHHVVRAMPGGVGGIPLKEGSMKHAATADVSAIRKGLVKYLDNYAASRPFPYPKVRPLDLKHLKVVALVQNDKTKEILQGVQIEVTGK